MHVRACICMLKLGRVRAPWPAAPVTGAGASWGNCDSLASSWKERLIMHHTRACLGCCCWGCWRAGGSVGGQGSNSSTHSPCYCLYCCVFPRIALCHAVRHIGTACSMGPTCTSACSMQPRGRHRVPIWHTERSMRLTSASACSMQQRCMHEACSM
eukprot:365219-Chlamydomonas_euryale.AAC.2